MPAAFFNKEDLWNKSEIINEIESESWTRLIAHSLLSKTALFLRPKFKCNSSILIK